MPVPTAKEIHLRSMDRAVRAAVLRRHGLTFREIAEKMGVTHPETARAAVAKGERILARRHQPQDSVK